MTVRNEKQLQRRANACGFAHGVWAGLRRQELSTISKKHFTWCPNHKDNIDAEVVAVMFMLKGLNALQSQGVISWQAYQDRRAELLEHDPKVFFEAIRRDQV